MDHSMKKENAAGSGSNGGSAGGQAGNVRTADVAGDDVRDTRVQQFLHDYRTEIAAGISSVVSTMTCFPLDSIKTRMQTYKFDGIRDCAMKTYRSEGLGAFWRGSLAPLVSISVVRTISMSTYTNVKAVYEPLLKAAVGRDAADPKSDLPTALKPFVWFLSGATAGATITAIACPFEFAKLSTQIQILVAKQARDTAIARGLPVPAVSLEPVGTIQSAKSIIRSRGFFGLYTGFRYHLARDTLGTALYFTIYETAKRALSQGDVASPAVIAASGGLCGLTSWALVYPIDTVKSTCQRDALRKGSQEAKRPRRIEFFNPRMYRGLGVSMLRSALVNAIFFSTFEHLKPMLKSME